MTNVTVGQHSHTYYYLRTKNIKVRAINESAANTHHDGSDRVLLFDFIISFNVTSD